MRVGLAPGRVVVGALEGPPSPRKAVGTSGSVQMGPGRTLHVAVATPRAEFTLLGGVNIDDGGPRVELVAVLIAADDLLRPRVLRTVGGGKAYDPGLEGDRIWGDSGRRYQGGLLAFRQSGTATNNFHHI